MLISFVAIPAIEYQSNGFVLCRSAYQDQQQSQPAQYRISFYMF